MKDNNYYAQSLNARKLYKVYETKYERVEQYLYAEIDYVKQNIKETDRVLELGAGYGRIVKELAPYCKEITGIDISEENVSFGKKYLRGVKNADLVVMDAHNLQLGGFYDTILCLQNGLSAMKIEPIGYTGILAGLLAPGGRIFISTYSPKFWEYRLLWFEEQSDKGLLGKIDMEKTKDGVIICKDGFRATTHSAEELDAIGKAWGFPYDIIEVDNSSLFLVITKG